MMNPPLPNQQPSFDAALDDDDTYSNPNPLLPPGIDPYYPNFTPSEDEQKEIVALCNEFKKNAMDHASDKKRTMRTAYSYIRGKFVGNDLLPLPTTNGSERDNNQNRPQVFIPLCRQQLKTIHAQMKMNIFPNDEDYFRVRAKTALGMKFEDELTEGLKYIFKQALISEKIGATLYQLVWSGMYINLPSVLEDETPEWNFEHGQKDQVSGDSLTPDIYTPRLLENFTRVTVQNLNPLNFYSDPTEPDPERARWVYADNKKCQQIKDSNLYINKDKLDAIEQKNVNEDVSNRGMQTGEITGLQNTFRDIQDTVRYDLYYFPYLKTATNEYRNFIIGVAGEQVLIRFNPNTFPRGMNPAVFTSWYYDPMDIYSQGPIEDIIEHQRLINIMWNYKIEVLARAGNRFAVRPNVDLKNFFGVAGGTVVTENPNEDIKNLSGDYSEIAALDNSIGMLKAEAQLVSGSQNPFQGSSQIDYKKTATELQIVNEQSISVSREAIEHIAIMGVQRTLEREMYLVADMYDQPVEIPVKNQFGRTEYRMIDFRLLKGGEYTIEMTGINPSQSKQAQINGLMQLAELVERNPQALVVGEPVFEKIGDLLGVKNVRELLDQIKERLGINNGPGLPGQVGMGAPQQPPMAGIPIANPPGPGGPPPQ